MIIKLTDGDTPYYLIWSDVVDAPTTYGCDLATLKDYFKVMYGPQGLEQMEKCLPRVESIGTSSDYYSSVDESIRFNRAGKNETCLTKEQILDYYCRHQGQGEEPVGIDPNSPLD